MNCVEDVDVKKYNYMENVLQTINQKFISLTETDVKLNNVILRKIVDEIVSRSKKQDPLFAKMYQKIFYGGSYYDGLKINNPEEYDLDIILSLPKIMEVKLECGEKHGYVFVAASEFEKFKKSAEAVKYPKIERLMCEGKYFSTKSVRSWMEGILSKVLQDLHNDEIIVNVDKQTLKPNIDHFKKSGPAFTLIVKTEVNGKESVINIDLVSCFIMTADQWPKGYVANPVATKENTFFVVPKKPYSSKGDDEKYWRLSFQEQEKELLKGKNYKGLKPSCKLIKQLRNRQDHKSICSYFIKTIFLWELRKQEQKLWMSTPLSFVFMTMLKRYGEYLKEGKIPYYWCPTYNLVGHIQKVTLEDFGNKVNNIIANVEKQNCDPFAIAKYLLPAVDVEPLKQEVKLGKKYAKKLQSVLAPLNTPSSHIEKEISSKLESDISTNQIVITNNLIDLNPIDYFTDDSTIDCICADLINLDVTDGPADDDFENSTDVPVHFDNEDSAISSNSLDDLSTTQNDITHGNNECCVHLRHEITNIREELQHLRKVTDSILHILTTKLHPTTLTTLTSDIADISQKNEGA